ncbi:MAG: hypothetical protein AMXMBFR84_31340 [Candidatus Hydrogenedentota bacterium]
MSYANRILVVDDESVIRELLSDILVDEGYPVETTNNGPEALEILRENDDFVLLFTDIMMPGMDGIQLVREARKIRPGLIPIVMTGFATLDTARAAVKEGAYDYVLKPFSLSEVKLAVSNALERYRLASENARLLELTEIFNISERLAHIHDETELLDYVLHAALDLVQAERGSIMLSTLDGACLEIAASVGLPDKVVKTLVPKSQSISGWVAEHNRPLLVENLKQSAEFEGLSRKLGDDSFVSLPLERNRIAPENQNGSPADRVLAVLNVCRKTTGDVFKDSDLKMLNILANQASAAIQNVRLIDAIKRDHVDTIRAMVGLVEAKEEYLVGHHDRVDSICAALGRKLGLNPEEMETLRLGAALYDIGRISVGDDILKKPGPLNDEEWTIIRRHPVVACSILQPMRFLSQEHVQIVRNHHERFDGTGYPDGLKGEEIPLLARIVALADAYAAMTSVRPFRQALDRDRALAEIQKCSSSQFDPEIARALVESELENRQSQSKAQPA